MYRWSVVPLAILLACAPASRSGAPSVPTPVDEGRAVAAAKAPEVVPPPAFRGAIAAGTRTDTGRPGPNYWQNYAEYTIELRVHPDSQFLEGSSTVRYYNNAPHGLNGLVVDLTQNFHAPGAMRLEPVEVTGGVQLRRVAVNGQELSEAEGQGISGYQVDGTKLLIVPPQPVAPNSTVELRFEWALRIPQQGAGGRMGHSRGNLIHLGYFYPQMAVLDDVVGWHPDQFLGTAEFYAGFGNYRVTIEAPAGWLVMGTGRLTNAEEVLAPEVLERLRIAEQSDTVVHVVTAEDLGQVTRQSSGVQRWVFEADSVRDVAYSLTRESVWDAARAPVGDRDGDGQTDYARVDAIYRQTAPLWVEMAEYAQHSVSFLSEFPGIEYPWPQMSVVEGGGIIGGGMEFPMITLIGEYTTAGPEALYNVAAHEIAHMWVPMIVSNDERRRAWMDEGTTNFNESQARKDRGAEAPELDDRTSYLDVARAELEGEIMRRSDYHYPGPAYGVATYAKPATVLATLREVLGEEVFLRAYREYLQRWRFKHPYPWDMWNTFEDVSGRDLDWFWKSWYYGTGVLDQAVDSVAQSSDSTEIVVRSLGEIPMPTRLTIQLDDGSVVEREIPVERWFGGADTVSLTVPGAATRVEIDAENAFPDVNRANNVWGG